MKPVLAKFSGMKVNIESSLRSTRNDKLQKFIRGELADNLRQMAKSYYSGHIGVVDEFLQLYCLGKEERTLALELQTKEHERRIPALPGWYWCRASLEHGWTMVEVRHCFDGESLDPGPLGVSGLPLQLNYWIGPIEPPQDMEPQ